MCAYNPFRWWTRGRPNKPLKSDAPLLLKIRNGDFDYSYMFNEAKEMYNSSKEAYDLTYKNYRGTDESNRVYVAQKAGKMKRVKAIKLEIEADKNEKVILWNLRKELTREFGKDLWNTAMQDVRGDGSLEDLYMWCKAYLNQGTTKSEMDIQFQRPNISGLEKLV